MNLQYSVSILFHKKLMLLLKEINASVDFFKFLNYQKSRTFPLNIMGRMVPDMSCPVA